MFKYKRGVHFKFSNLHVARDFMNQCSMRMAIVAGDDVYYVVTCAEAQRAERAGCTVFYK